MIRLLVSVRDADEAEIAVQGGADLIDVKEPSAGSLGAADPVVWQSVRSRVPGQLPVSAALGELLDEHILQRARQALGLQFVKVGLAGAAQHSRWQQRWQQTLDAVPPDTARVAVVYADWPSCAAPEPRQVIQVAAELGCRFLLVDTFIKTRGDLFDLLDANALMKIVQQVRRQDMRLVLAGSLSAARLQQARALAPDYIAVRGAVCEGGRAGRIALGRVVQLSSLLRGENESARHAS